MAGRLNPIGHAVNALYIADCLVILAMRGTVLLSGRPSANWIWVLRDEEFESENVRGLSPLAGAAKGG